MKNPMTRTRLRRIALVAALAGATALAPPPRPAAAKEATVQCANLIYAGNRTSRCFSDQFLSEVQKKTTIATERRFKPVKLAADELFQFPFVVMTGEGDFHLTSTERDNLKAYLEGGGFLLASAGCSAISSDISL